MTHLPIIVVIMLVLLLVGAALATATPTPTPAPTAGPPLIYEGQPATNILGFLLTGTGSLTPLVNLTKSGTAFTLPYSVTVDSLGNIWVADRTTAVISEFPPGATGDVAPTVTISGANTQLTDPRGLYFDVSGNLWVTNATAGSFGLSVEMFSAANIVGGGNISPTTRITYTGAFKPNGVVLDSSGRIIVADQGYGANSYGAILTFAAGANGASTPTYPVLGATAGTVFQNPRQMAIDSNGRIYLASTITNSIPIYTAAQLATGGDNVAPSAQISGANTGISSPQGVWLDSAGNVYVSDGTPAIREWNVGSLNFSATNNIAPNRIITSASLQVSAGYLGIFQGTPTATPTPTILATATPTPSPTPGGCPTQAALTNPQNPVAYGADPTGAANSSSAFASALAVGDLEVPAGTFLMAAGDPGISVPNGRKIHCNSATVLNMPATTSSTVFKFDNNSSGSVFNCHFRGPNYNLGASTTQTGAFQKFIVHNSTNTSGTAGNLVISGNDFNGIGGFIAAVQVYGGTGQQPPPHNDVIACNTFSNCAVYSMQLTSQVNAHVFNNTSVDCDFGPEADTYPGQANTGLIAENNNFSWLYGTGYAHVSGQHIYTNYFTCGNSASGQPFDYSGNLCRNNTISGVVTCGLLELVTGNHPEFNATYCNNTHDSCFADYPGDYGSCPTPTPTPTPRPTSTPTPAPTGTITPIPTPTVTPKPTAAPTQTPLSTGTPIPTSTPMSTPKPTETPTATVAETPTPTPTQLPTPKPTATGSPAPTFTATFTPTATLVPTQTGTPTATPTGLPPTPTQTGTPTQTPVPACTPGPGCPSGHIWSIPSGDLRW